MIRQLARTGLNVRARCLVLVVALIFITSMLLVPGRTLAEAAPDAGALYQKHCSVCHGDSGDGQTHARPGLNPPPRDFTAATQTAGMGRERMIASVTHGIPGTAMVGWDGRLSKTEIDAIVDYVVENFVSAANGTSTAGARIYAANCSVCHGDTGEGAVWGRESLATPPRNFRSAAALRELTRERMITSVSHGRAGTPMPGFATQLGGDEIEWVVDFIRTQFMQTDSTNASATADAPGHAASPQHPRVAAATGRPAGDATLGRAYYLLNCVACHGASGDGQGPRAYFIRPPPRDFTSVAARASLDRDRLFTSIKRGIPGREMPAWGTVLTDEQIAGIAEYVFREFITTDEGNDVGN